MASFVILVWCHFVSPYNVGGSANSVLCRGRHFWKIARVNAHWIFACSAWTEKSSLNRHLKTWGSARAWDSAGQTVSIFAFSSVVKVGVRPVGLRFKIIPSSRNVLTLWAMKFWDSVWESWSCSPVQAELATKFNALVLQQFHRNDHLDTEHYLLNHPHDRVTQSDI